MSSLIVINRSSMATKKVRVGKVNNDSHVLPMRSGSMQNRKLSRRNPALHRAMYAGLEIADVGPAVERAERRLQQLGAEAGGADILYHRAFGLIPGDVEPVVRHCPRHLQHSSPR